MKKITAFFLVLLPFFITGLMFISGLIQSLNFPVSVVGISIAEPDQDVPWDSDQGTYSGDTVKFSAHVLPLNAKNQEISWSTSDPTVATVDGNGKLNILGYGKTVIKATAVGNTSCFATREVDVYDTVAHDIKVSNSYNLGYVAPGTTTKVSADTIPSMDHVESLESITYSLDPQVTKFEDDDISVDKNTGIVTTLPRAAGSEGKIVEKKIYTTVKSHDSARPNYGTEHPKTKETTIKIGPALDTLSWINTNNEDVKTPDNYNLYDQICFAPATKDVITNDDFIYETDDTEGKILTVDNETDTKTGKVAGKVRFKQFGKQATVTVTYKRNTNLKISKKIQAYQDGELKEIFFNRSSLQIPFDYAGEGGSKYIPFTKDEAPKEHPEYVLNWTTYPEDKIKGLSNITVVSTNTDVVDVDYTKVGGQPRLLMKAPGKCALMLYVGGTEICSDACEITVTTPIGDDQFIKDDPTITGNVSSYYVLRNHVNVEKSSINPQTIKYELVSGNDAYIDEDNGILHFKTADASTATIRVYIGDDTLGKEFTFTKAKATVNTLDDDFEKGLIKVRVGEPVKFDNYTPTFEGKYYEQHFDVLQDGTFIAKRGADIPDFEVTKDGETKTVHFIIEELPVYVNSEVNPLLLTPDTEVEVMSTFNPQVYPSTATKSDGTSYQAEFDAFIADNESTCTRIDNTITFSRIGTCLIHINFGIIDPKDPNPEVLDTWYAIRSTYNDNLGRFKVVKNATLPSWRTVMGQYDQWDPTETLRIDVSQDYESILQIKSMTGLCVPTITWNGILGIGHYVVSANPIPGRDGDDIIEISSPTYSLFLKVHVDAEITNFTVSCQQDTWDSSEPILTYTDNLNIRVTPNTLGRDVEEKKTQWAWQLNDGDISDPITGSDTIKGLSLSDGENTLHLYKAEDTTTPIKSFVINKKAEKDAKVSLYGCDNGIYAAYNASSKSAVITTDGYVDDNFYSNFKMAPTSGSSKLKIESNNTKNIWTVSNIEATTNEQVELVNSTISFSKSYDVGKDQISRIKLPGHNINDESDKKGMQKVHVYGNTSWYDGKQANYYKVKVELYDAKRSPIGKDMGPEKAKEAKIKALKSLNINVGQNSKYEIDPSGDYIRVFFDKSDVYSVDQIYNNAFDTKSGKNVDFSVSTKSNEVSANYKFVVVDGMNVWDSQPIYLISEQKGKGQKLMSDAVVLQKNFGVLPYNNEDNAVLDKLFINETFWMPGIYGNGYVLDFKYMMEKSQNIPNAATNPVLKFAINTNIHGAEPNVISSRKKQIYLQQIGWEYECDRYWAYDIIHDFSNGLTHHFYFKCNFKNCVFYNFVADTLTIDALDKGEKECPDVRIENCAFFNAGGFPITAFGDTPIRFKGDIGIYNFQDKEMLRHIKDGVDLTSLWPGVLAFARSTGMVHIDHKGDEVVNSFMINALNPSIYFWDWIANDWVITERGFPGSAKYLAKYGQIKVPFIRSLTASLWGGTNPSREKDAPSYFDEFDNEGKFKYSFLSEQIIKRTRVPVYF